MTSGLEQLVINIEHDIDEQYQYTPGEIIRGQIVITMRRTTVLSSITIHIKGEGVVGWEDNTTGSSYNANEIYINATKQLTESVNTQLQSGEHSFDFEYELPDNLPSSYIGKYGSVTYVLKATAIGEHRTDTIITSEPFLVLRDTFLPVDSDRKAYIETKKKIRNTCCTFGNIRINAAVQKVGLLPGEDMFIDAEIKNKSAKAVEVLEASLVMDTRYHANKAINNFRQIINRRRDEVELTHNEGRRWQNVRLAVPPYIPESKLEHCDIIDVHYCFQLKVELEGEDNICLSIPIVIATHENEQPRKESMANYDLINSNNTWTDLTLQRQKKLTEINLANGEPNSPPQSPNQPSWYGLMPPQMRSDTNVENPLFDNSSPISKEFNPEILENTKLDNRKEVIESTKL